MACPDSSHKAEAITIHTISGRKYLSSMFIGIIIDFQNLFHPYTFTVQRPLNGH